MGDKWLIKLNTIHVDLVPWAFHKSHETSEELLIGRWSARAWGGEQRQPSGQTCGMFHVGRYCSLVALIAAVTFGRPNGDFQLTIVHVNDIHARFQETSRDGEKCQKEGPCYGGMARVAEAASRILKEERNSIFLNAGDNYQGSIWYTVFNWNVTVEILNLLPFDAMVSGRPPLDIHYNLALSTQKDEQNTAKYTAMLKLGHS